MICCTLGFAVRLLLLLDVILFCLTILFDTWEELAQFYIDRDGVLRLFSLCAM